MADILGIADYINRAGQQGRAQFEKREIGSSIGRLLSGEGDRNAEIGAIAKLDPDAGIQANTLMGQLDDASVKRLGQQASVFTALPPDQKAAVYPSLAREAQRLGYQVPGEYRPEMDAAIDRLAQTFGGRGSETPSQQRYAEWLLAQVPAEDRDQALGVLAGTKARPPTGGYGFGTVEWGGREAPTRTNPRDGSQEVWSGQAWVPLGSQPTYSQPPAQGYGVQPLPGDQISIIEQEIGRPLTQQERGQIASGTLNLQVPVAQPVGQSPSATRVSNPGASMVGADLPPRLDYQNGGVIPGAPGIGRTPDEQAGLTTRAQQEAELDYLPERERIKTQAEIDREQAKADIERAAESPKRVARYQSALKTAENVGVSIDNAMELIGPMSTGFIGARSRGIEGSPAYNLAAEIETIKANLGFDRLQEMRDNSPTGGALGQVAIQELVALQSTVANLDPNQSDEQLRANLQRIQDHYARWRATVEQSLAQERGGQPAQQGGNTTRRLKFNPATGRIE